MLVLLPVVAFVLVFLCLRARRGSRSFRENALHAAVVLGSFTVLITEALSLFHAVSVVGVAVWWAGVCGVAAAVLWRFRGHPSSGLQPVREKLSRPDLFIVAGLVLYLGVTVVIALVAPPNTWDALEYHMPKVMHWMQNGSVWFYPTAIPRQNHLAPGAEIVVMHLHLLAGSDRFTNMVEWLAMAGCLAAVSLIARELGARALGQGLAAVFAITLPTGIMQATSAQTDYVLAFWFVSFVWFFIRLLRSDTFSWPTLLGLAASLGLAALTKATVYLFAPAFLLWLAWWLFRRLHGRAFAACGLITAVFLALNCGHYARNWSLYGHPLGPRQEPDANTQYALGTHTPAALLSSVSKHVGTHLTTPWPGLNASILRGYGRLHEALGFDLNDRRTTFGPDWVKFSVGLTDFHDETAGNPVHAALALTCVLLVVGVPSLRRDPVLLRYTLAVAAGFLLIALYLRWHPWMGRLHHGIFVAAAPFVAVVLTRHARAWLGVSSAGLLVLLGLPWLLFCQQRPVVAAENIFTTPRVKTYFKNPHQRHEAAFTEGGEFLRSLSFSRLGLLTGNSSWEYLWWLYARQDHEAVRIEHVNVRDISQVQAEKAPFEDFEPEVVVALDQRPQPAETLTVGGATFTRRWMHGRVGIYIRD